MLHIILFLTLVKSAISGNIVRITSESEFKDFENNVDSGTNYLGTTVYLSSDISFSEITPGPIGKSENYYNCFQGVFDGQGYVINNLTMNSSSLQYMGLFGYSSGLTIKNVVLDGSCSIISSNIQSSTNYVGGIIGECYAEGNKCDIENVVNMANVSFDGCCVLYLGGIAGNLYIYISPWSGYEIYVKNCANYGSVTGDSGDSYIGGIVGYSSESSSSSRPYHIYLQNCFNYGKITNSDTSRRLYIGGITGYAYRTYTENCASTGKISEQNTAASSHIGSIVGHIGSYVFINYCYYTSDVSINKIYGYTESTPSITETFDTPTNVDSDLVSKLNSNATSCNWNKWLLNANNAAVTFKINDDKEISFSSQIILIPDPVKEGNSFLYWCKDAECAERFDVETENINGATDLYANWAPNNYTVTFNVTGGDSLSEVEATKTVTFDKEYGELPEPSRAGYTFVGWFDDDDKPITNEVIVATPKNHTLYANWAPNNYTVTFNVTGGDALSDDKATKTVIFDKEYGELPEPSRAGYTFAGWFDDDDKPITNEAIVTTPKNHTLYANWAPNNYTLTFNVSGGDSLSDDKATKTVTFDKKYDVLPESSRAGYTFAGWFTEKNELITNEATVKTPKNLTLYANWVANNYTVTFNVSGGDSLSEVEATKTVTFNKEYGDLPDPSRTGYTFAGWFDEDDKNVVSKTIVTNPSNHTLYARWKEIPKAKEEKSKTKSNSSLVAGITVPVVVVVVAVVVIILFIFLKKKHDNDDTRRKSHMGVELTSQQREEYCRVVAASMDETETNNASESSQGVLKNLYPQVYSIPSMRDALLEAGLTKNQTVYVCDACQNISRRALNEGKLFDGFTEGDAAAIAMYTYDFGPGNFESNPYRIINKSLVGRNYNNLQKASGLLYLVMAALRKLPRYTGKAMYRGVRGDVNLDKGHYHKGNVIMWSALSSTSPDMETTKAFLAKESKSGKAEGTLFIIEGGWGYNIQPYSLFPDEVEILLEPERLFRVTGVIEAEGLTFINLQMLDTPLSIPEVFGEN